MDKILFYCFVIMVILLKTLYTRIMDKNSKSEFPIYNNKISDKVKLSKNIELNKKQKIDYKEKDFELESKSVSLNRPSNFFNSLFKPKYIYEISNSNKNVITSNETPKILEIYPIQDSVGFTIPLNFGSNEYLLSMYIDIFNSYSYVMSQNMKNSTINSCGDIFDYYNNTMSISYKKDDSKIFDSKIFIRDFNLTGKPSLEEAKMKLYPYNTSIISNFSFYLIDNAEIKYNNTKCLSISGGFGFGFSGIPGITYLDQLKLNGIIEKKIFSYLLPLQNEDSYLHLGGYKKDWINDTNMINWVNVSIMNVSQEAHAKKLWSSKEKIDPNKDMENNFNNIEFPLSGNIEYSLNNNNNVESLNSYLEKTKNDGVNEILSLYNLKYNDYNQISKSELKNLININENDDKLKSDESIQEENLKADNIKTHNHQRNGGFNSLSNDDIYRESIIDQHNKLLKLSDKNRLNWFIPSDKIYLRKEKYLGEHKIVFNSMSENIIIPKKFFFDNFKNIFGPNTDCKMEQDGFFYCKCYPSYSENFPIFYLEFNSSFNITIKPQDYVQIIINYSDDDVRPCRLLMKLNYNDDYWELGVFVMNNFYMIFNQETNQLGFYDRDYINQIGSDQAIIFILIVFLASIFLFLIVYCWFKKYIGSNNNINENNNNIQNNLIS